jgi:hypothetical protein
MALTTLIGFAGGLAVLVSFAGVASGRLSTHGATHPAMNVSGALATVAVNVSWALISAHGLVRALTPPRPVREPRTDEHPIPAL